MERSTKNIIEELDRFVSDRNKHQIIEARASNIIGSAINLLNLISESFAVEEAEELNRRILSAIKNKDVQKFNRKIREYSNIEEIRNKNVK